MKDKPKQSPSNKIMMLKASLEMLLKAPDTSKLTPKQIASLNKVNKDLKKALLGQLPLPKVKKSLDDFNDELKKTFKKASVTQPPSKQDDKGKNKGEKTKEKAKKKS